MNPFQGKIHMHTCQMLLKCINFYKPSFLTLQVQLVAPNPDDPEDFPALA